MFVDIAKIKIKAGNGATVPSASAEKNMLPQAVPTAATAAEAETLFFRLTTTSQPLPISAIRENTLRPTVKTVQAAEKAVAEVKTS